MWLLEFFKLLYIFCISFLPVIVDTGVQVRYADPSSHAQPMDQVWNGLEINATDIRRTEEWNRAPEPVTTQRPSKPCPLPEISNNQGDWFCWYFDDKVTL